MRTLVAVVVVAMLVGLTARAGNLAGVPRVVDGDTLSIGAMTLRLEGVDAPETDQVCLDKNRSRWTCGIEARDRLAAQIGGREIICTSNGIDAFKRTLATCRLNGEDLNAWMVREGWALAYVKYSPAYRGAEDEARVHQRGL